MSPIATRRSSSPPWHSAGAGNEMSTGSDYLHRDTFQAITRLVTAGRRWGAGLPVVSPRCEVSRPTWPAMAIVRRAQSWALDLPIAGAAELGVTGAQTQHSPLYLRTFVRLLSSWVHRCCVRCVAKVGRGRCCPHRSRRHGAARLLGRRVACSPTRRERSRSAVALCQGIVSSGQRRGSDRLHPDVEPCEN